MSDHISNLCQFCFKNSCQKNCKKIIKRLKKTENMEHMSRIEPRTLKSNYSSWLNQLRHWGQILSVFKFAEIIRLSDSQTNLNPKTYNSNQKHAKKIHKTWMNSKVANDRQKIFSFSVLWMNLQKKKFKWNWNLKKPFVIHQMKLNYKSNRKENIEKLF